MTKIIELITLSKTFTIILNRKSKFGLPHTSFSNLGWFFGGFWGANIIKSGHNLKNIWKFPKHNLNISFVGNLIIYSKGCKQLYSMPHPFKETVITFWFFVWVGTPWELNINSQIFTTVTKKTSTTILSKLLTCISNS